MNGRPVGTGEGEGRRRKREGGGGGGEARCKLSDFYRHNASPFLELSLNHFLLGLVRSNDTNGTRYNFRIKQQLADI